MKKSVYKDTGGLRTRRRRRRVRVLFGFFLLLALIAGGAVAAMWLPSVRISAISMTGVETTPTSTVEGSVQKILAGTYWLVLPKNNIFIYPKQAIEDGLRAQFSAILHVGVSARDFHTIDIVIEERKPKALWCGTAVASSSACMVLDQDGVAYSAAADFSGGAYVRYFGIVTGAQSLQFLTPDTFHALTALVAELAKKSGPISAVTVEGGGDVRVSFANGFDLLFSLGDDGADILIRYTLVLSAEPFSKRATSDFLYLDLRFGDKLYYKLKVRP